MSLFLPTTSLVADYYALISYLEEESLPYQDPQKLNAITWQWGGNVTLGYNPQGMVLMGMKGTELRRMGFSEISIAYSLDLQLQVVEPTVHQTNAMLLAWGEYLSVHILPELSEQGLTGIVQVEGEEVAIEKAFLKAHFDRVSMNIKGEESACYGILMINGSFNKTFNSDICTP
jgi:hypothetical protein